MGTNFYMHRIPTEEEIQSMHSAIDERDFDKLDEIIERATECIHIGKYSSGWKFLFRTNAELYPKSLEGVKNWILSMLGGSGGYELKNEYGENVDFGDFWKDVIDTYNNPECYDGPSWDAAHGKTYPRCSGYETISKDRSRWSDTDFS